MFFDGKSRVKWKTFMLPTLPLVIKHWVLLRIEFLFVILEIFVFVVM